MWDSTAERLSLLIAIVANIGLGLASDRVLISRYHGLPDRPPLAQGPYRTRKRFRWPCRGGTVRSSSRCQHRPKSGDDRTQQEFRVRIKY